MAEIVPKTKHTNTAAQLRELKKVLVKFNERVLQMVEKDTRLLQTWNLHEPGNVKKLRQQLKQRSRVAVFEPEKRLKTYAETGEKHSPEGNEMKIAVLAAIIAHHNQLFFDRVTGTENWEL